MFWCPSPEVKSGFWCMFHNQVTESKHCVTHLKSLNVNSDVILVSYF